jgi:hypothetical protein
MKNTMKTSFLKFNFLLKQVQVIKSRWKSGLSLFNSTTCNYHSVCTGKNREPNP